MTTKVWWSRITPASASPSSMLGASLVVLPASSQTLCSPRVEGETVHQENDATRLTEDIQDVAHKGLQLLLAAALDNLPHASSLVGTRSPTPACAELRRRQHTFIHLQAIPGKWVRQTVLNNHEFDRGVLVQPCPHQYRRHC